MKASFLLFCVIALIGCAQIRPVPQASCNIPEDDLDTAGDVLAEYGVERIDQWKMSLSPVARSVQLDPELLKNEDVKRLFAQAADSLNVYIDAVVGQLPNKTFNCGHLRQLALSVDSKTDAFVKYVGSQNAAALDIVALSPVIESFLKLLIGELRTAYKENDEAYRKEIDRLKAELVSRKIDTNIASFK